MIGLPGPDMARRNYAPLSETFNGKGTTDLGVADTGQAWFLAGTDQVGAYLSIIDGKLTNTASDAAIVAGYVSADIGEPVTHIGCTFTLASGNTGGVAVLLVWKSILQGNFSIPDSPCHLTISPVHWDYGTWTNHVLTSRGDGVLDLSADDTTQYAAEITIAGDTATLVLPGISDQIVTHASIASNVGNFAGFEVFQGDGSADVRAKFVSVYAS